MRELNGSPGVEPERGASIIIVSISIAAVLIVATLAVDLGLLWTSKRELVKATDAAAFEAAIAAYEGAADPCANEVPPRLAANHPDATIDDCEVVANSTSGIATVTATEITELAFAPLIGANRARETSTTTVEWGIPSAATGVLPLGLCLQAPGIEAFLLNPVETTLTIEYDKSVPTDCGGNKVPGNWGILSLNCHLPDVAPNCKSNNSNVKNWILNGFPGDVVAGDPIASPCEPNPTTGCYGGDPGSSGGSFSSELATHIGEDRLFPIYDDASSRGSNARFHIIGFVKAEIVDFVFTGNGKKKCGGAKQCLILTLKPGLIDGTCCADGGLDTGLRTARICGIVREDFSRCSNADLL